MNPIAAAEPSASEVAELQAGISQCLIEIEQLHAQMQSDQAEIDRSQRRTHALLAELKAAVSPSGPKAT